MILQWCDLQWWYYNDDILMNFIKLNFILKFYLHEIYSINLLIVLCNLKFEIFIIVIALKYFFLFLWYKKNNNFLF